MKTDVLCSTQANVNWWKIQYTSKAKKWEWTVCLLVSCAATIHCIKCSHFLLTIIDFRSQFKKKKKKKEMTEYLYNSEETRNFWSISMTSSPFLAMQCLCSVWMSNKSFAWIYRCSKADSGSWFQSNVMAYKLGWRREEKKRGKEKKNSLYIVKLRRLTQTFNANIERYSIQWKITKQLNVISLWIRSMKHLFRLAIIEVNIHKSQS